MKTYFGGCIQDYEVYELLGKGGFAHVYRGKCLRTGIFVAIKMISKQAMHASGMSKRVQQEISIHSKLKHSSILELYTFFEDLSYVYMVLELAKNGELQHCLRLRSFNESEAAFVLCQVVEGLIYLHSRRILHRDISLSNLLLSENMNVKIADFGLATELNMPEEKHLTLCGTPNYISPEVASRSSHGLPADVWGLGCMLYTLLVGRPPFDTNGIKSTLTRVVMSDYILPHHISPDASDLIERLLKKNPDERMQLQSVLTHPFMRRCLPHVSSNNRIVTSKVDSGVGTISSSDFKSDLLLFRTEARKENDACSQQKEERLKSGVFGSNVKQGEPQLSLLQKFNSLELKEKYNINKSDILGYSQSDNLRLQLPAFESIQAFQTERRFGKISKETFSGAKHHNQFVQQNSEHSPVFSRPCPKYHEKNILTPTNDCEVPETRKECIQLPPPFNTARLVPDRHRTKHVILSIAADSGEVVLEFLKPKGRMREEHVVEVCRISADGLRFVSYQPGGSRGVPAKDKPPDLPAHGADTIHSYENIPRKHWKKYVYAARFVKMVKAKTPKITLYSVRAKCQLMETLQDYEVVFYDGCKIVLTDDVIRMLDTTGTVYRGITNFPAESVSKQEHFRETLEHCLNIERTLSMVSTNGKTFPVIIGRRPVASSEHNDRTANGNNLLNLQSTPRTPLSNTALGSFAFSVQSFTPRSMHSACQK
ncbi:serine/threonine-protein kinase PLK4 [Anopheles bellator]|uniref:serine/threonine-protein kinase PLK4 n=1 Tax=Anopheles bellator TaxID=139047 RepID=UPI002648109A|nr:serine/threonine-protein kinase PLK4 [Anopheles bellator]